LTPSVGAFAADIAELAAEHAQAIQRIIPQRELAIEVDAIERGVVIGELQEHKAVRRGEIGRRARRPLPVMADRSADLPDRGWVSIRSLLYAVENNFLKLVAMR
jgi:hypothetical protein